MMTTVLFTDGLLAETLAAVRSLGSRGIRCLVGEKIRFHPGGCSKYCAKELVYPDPKTQPGDFMIWLKETIKRERCGMVYLMADEAMNTAMAHRDELEELCIVPFPSAQSHQVCADKGRTIELAAAAGVPCPATLQPAGPEALADPSLLAQLAVMRYPLAIKPRFSSGSRGFRVVHSQAELLATYAEVHRQYPNPLIQAYIAPGPKFDACLCYDREHRVAASFVQQRIRNYPLGKGSSTVHRSVIRSDLLQYAEKLLSRLDWFGVADVEFMVDGDSGVPYLMEINPRFWSSLHLAVRCGVDFPWLLYQLASGMEVEPVTAYTAGKTGRALLPGDILHFLSNPKRWQMDPPIWAKLPDATLSAQDPLPALGFFLAALRLGFDPKTWRYFFKR